MRVQGYLVSPFLAYNFSELIESHAVDTYTEFAEVNKELLISLPATPQVRKGREGKGNEGKKMKERGADNGQRATGLKTEGCDVLSVRVLVARIFTSVPHASAVFCLVCPIHDTDTQARRVRYRYGCWWQGFLHLCHMHLLCTVLSAPSMTQTSKVARARPHGLY